MNEIRHTLRPTGELIYEPIYKFDTKGKARIWMMEQAGGLHRSIAGILNGNLVTSGWTQCEATNVGRANERNPELQAQFEIEAAYEKKLTREYHRTLDAAGGGAHFFKPMLANKYKKFAPGYAQPKLDGIRCIAKADGLWSREGNALMGAPHVFAALSTLFEGDSDLILDGELYNHDYKDDFNSICSAVRKEGVTPEQIELAARLVQYHVYDMPSVKGVFSQRTAAIANILDYVDPDIIRPVETVEVTTAEEYDNLHGDWIAAGYEGSIWRDDKPYEQKRSNVLRKRKEFFDEEFPISMIGEGKGNWAGCAKFVEFIMPGDKRCANGERPRAGIKGSQPFARQLLVEREQYKIVTVRYTVFTPDGIPRNPVATKFHGEKREL